MQLFYADLDLMNKASQVALTVLRNHSCSEGYTVKALVDLSSCPPCLLPPCSPPGVTETTGLEEQEKTVLHCDDRASPRPGQSFPSPL